MTATWITGNTLEVLRRMPTDSVDLVMTSPPFLALRSYLPDDDPAKADEIGQEPTPGEFIDALVEIVEELRRVVAPHGSICVELGDTFAGSGGHGGDYEDGGMRDGQPKFAGAGRAQRRHDGRDSSAYGTGAAPRPARRRQPPNAAERHHPDGSLKTSAAARETPRWRARNVVRWVRPNPPVGALGDKFRPGTSEMVVLTGTDEAGRRRYFDLDAVRTPSSGYERAPAARATPPGQKPRTVLDTVNPAGAPPLDWWEIPTAPYKGSHYATYPPELCRRPILAMSPQRVCTTCGEPSRRITEEVSPRKVDEANAGKDRLQGREVGGAFVKSHTVEPAVTRTVGWTDCGHGTWRPGVVLDPFGGSGTTLAVATGHGRDAIGIDLDTRNVELARDRIGPMFFTETTVDDLWPEEGAA